MCWLHQELVEHTFLLSLFTSHYLLFNVGMYLMSRPVLRLSQAHQERTEGRSHLASFKSRPCKWDVLLTLSAPRRAIYAIAEKLRLENVSSIGTLTSNNTPYERQTARLNRETARQAEIKSNPAPVIWLYAHRSGLDNLIPGLFPQKAKCHSGEVAGRERGLLGSGCGEGGGGGGLE